MQRFLAVPVRTPHASRAWARVAFPCATAWVREALPSHVAFATPASVAHGSTGAGVAVGVGAGAGGRAGVTNDAAVDEKLGPAVLRATTVAWYDVPGVRPLTVHDVAAVAHVAPPGEMMAV